MIRSFIERQIRAQEELLGMPLPYLRHIAEASLPALVKFMLIMPMARHRNALPIDVYHVAALVAARVQDCGTCVQIGINVARKEDVPPAVIRAVLDDRPDDLSADLARVYRYARKVVQQQDDPDLREHLRERYGEEGLVELAFALAVGQVFPVVKRTLGYATVCTLVDVPGDDVPALRSMPQPVPS